MGTINWQLKLHVEQATRLLTLQGSVQFKKLAEDIAASMAVLCCHRSSISGKPISRVAYCVQVERRIFDLFFNSASGYRAAYFRSPGEGINANATFFEVVTPKLLSTDLSITCGLEHEYMRQSLVTPSAKVWLAECGKEVERDCVTCQGEWSVSSVRDGDEPEILNGVWEQSKHIKSIWGCKAPFLTKLRIMGAFLDDHLNEWIPTDKRFRAREIHEHGWS